MRRRSLLTIPGIVVVAAGCDGIRTPSNGRTPHPEHDPVPLNPPHSPQPRDKYIFVIFRAQITQPIRPSIITWQVGQKVMGPIRWKDKSWTSETYKVGIGTTCHLLVRNDVVNDEPVAGFLYGDISVIHRGTNEIEVRRQTARRGGTQPIQLRYVTQERDA